MEKAEAENIINQILLKNKKLVGLFEDKTKGVLHRDANKLRLDLQKDIINVLGSPRIHPELIKAAANVQLDVILWQSCFYRIIEEFRKLIRAKSIKHAPDLPKFSEGLGFFLRLCSDFYVRFIRSLQAVHALDLEKEVCFLLFFVFFSFWYLYSLSLISNSKIIP